MKYVLSYAAGKKAVFSNADDAAAARDMLHSINMACDLSESLALNGVMLSKHLVDYMISADVAKVNKVVTIKLLRELTGAGLKDAVDFYRDVVAAGWPQ